MCAAYVYVFYVALEAALVNPWGVPICTEGTCKIQAFCVCLRRLIWLRSPRRRA